LQNWFFARLLSSEARASAAAEPGGTLDDFRGHKYCLAVTYRTAGEPVPTPVWFGIAGGRLYFRTEAPAGKVKRIRANGRIRVVPSTWRGKPRGQPVEGRARIVPRERESDAEAAIASNYGIGRRIYRRLLGARPHDAVYVEVTSAP
jgi:PPOX class probable F420-dependent enzyme